MIYTKRVKEHQSAKRKVLKTWQGNLQGFPCFLVANGPSLDDVKDIHLIDNYFSIGINRPFKKDDFDPTILMWQDIELWRDAHEKIRTMKAIKFCRDVADFANIAYHFKLVGGPFALPTNPAVLYGSGSSGPLAFELARCLKCKHIVLLGYDCCYRGEKTDFYGKNKHHSSYTLKNCKKGLKWMKGWSEKPSCRIINCSTNEYFQERFSLEEAIEIVKRECPDGMGEHKNRDFFIEKIFSKASEK